MICLSSHINLIFRLLPKLCVSIVFLFFFSSFSWVDHVKMPPSWFITYYWCHGTNSSKTNIVSFHKQNHQKQSPGGPVVSNTWQGTITIQLEAQSVALVSRKPHSLFPYFLLLSIVMYLIKKGKWFKNAELLKDVFFFFLVLLNLIIFCS